MRIFETDRLAARWLRPDDIEDFYALAAHPDLFRYMGAGEEPPRDAIEQWLEKSIWNYANSGWGCFGVTTREGDGLIGFAGFARPSDRPGVVELIYFLHPDYWGRGLATELARSMCEYGFTACGLTRIEATIHPDNVASIRVIEKIGMVYFKSETWDDGSSTRYYAVDRFPTAEEPV